MHTKVIEVNQFELNDDARRIVMIEAKMIGTDSLDKAFTYYRYWQKNGNKTYMTARLHRQYNDVERTPIPESKWASLPIAKPYPDEKIME